MADTLERRPPWAPNPVHAIVLAAPLPLFLGALLSDWAYSSSYELQWKNFASWLLAGGLVFTGLALLFAVIDWLRADRVRSRGRWLYPLLLAAVLVAGFLSALIHAKDAYASMPTGLVLSIVTFVLAVGANWAAYRGTGAPR